MPQITLYLDEAMAISMREQVKAAGVSSSHWVAHLIRRSVKTLWRLDVLGSFGVFPEAPLANELGALEGPEPEPGREVTRLLDTNTDRYVHTGVGAAAPHRVAV